jgi:mediator of RNA polymerase II transcription subunit 12
MPRYFIHASFLIPADIFIHQDVGSRHRLFLSWIPLGNSTLSLTNQRKVTLYGARARETPEDIIEREMRKEIRTVLPNLFEGLICSLSSFESNFDKTQGSPQCPLPSTTTLLTQCKTLISATRFEQVRTFRQWLLPVFRKHIKCAFSTIL